MIIDATSLVTNPQGNRPQNPALLIGHAIHHTVGLNTVERESDERATIVAIDRMHVAQGFGGFGYHGIVFPSGRAYKCGEGQRAHVARRNHELRGWAFSGTYTSVLPTDAAWDGMREALLSDGAITVKGHREWALPGEGTACPGIIVPKDWDAFLYPSPPLPIGPVGIGVHYVDGSEEEVWNAGNPGNSSKTLDGIGARFADGRIETLWP